MMMGGMGGMMGGGMPAPQGSSQQTNLLEGIQNANRANQGQQIQQLKGRYKSGSDMNGQGGVGGGFF
jgi:hypothetical protein